MFSLLRSLPASASTSVSRTFSTSSALLAHKKGAGSTKNNRGSIGRRLGVKKFADEIVQPGDIITRQRGMKIHAGQNVGVGRDQTLFALTPGYLKFYSLPHHPSRPTLSPNIPNRRPPRSSVPVPETNRPKGYRRYVGITLRRDASLPRDERALGRERLWFGTVEPENGERTWEWQQDGPGGEGRFVRTDAGAPAPQEGKADGGLDALGAGEGAGSSPAAESSDARP